MHGVSEAALARLSTDPGEPARSGCENPADQAISAVAVISIWLPVFYDKKKWRRPRSNPARPGCPPGNAHTAATTPRRFSMQAGLTSSERRYA